MINKLISVILPYMPQKFIWIFSKRYIAGETIQDAIKVSKELNDKSIMVTLDILGEFIKTLEEAEQNRMDYINLIETIEKEQITGNFSLKPSMFGLLIDKEICYNYLHSIVAKAAGYNRFIRIDMEDSPCTSDTLELYRRLKTDFPQNCGVVVQAYLKRTLDDVKALMDIHTLDNPNNFRLCKGIYIEPSNIAYKKDQDIHRHYLEDLEYMLANGIYVGIATHHKKLIEGAFELIEKYKVPNNKYEFQMLYGVTPELRQQIIEKGHRMRVYVPYGKKWFRYCTRRFKENPKMASMIIKAIFVQG
jgi:proline dehydrogenase